MNLARALAPGVEAAYALLRISAGLMFACHGAQKLGLIPDSRQGQQAAQQAADLAQQLVELQMKIAPFIELGTGVAIAAGIWTTWAAFLASGTMAVAYVQFHWKLQLGDQLIPLVNKGELALLYSVLFLYMACRGGGRWSLDAGKRIGRRVDPAGPPSTWK